MTSQQILSRLAEIENGLLESGNPQKFAASQAYKQVLSEIDAMGFKRFESVYMVYKARQTKGKTL